MRTAALAAAVLVAAYGVAWADPPAHVDPCKVYDRDAVAVIVQVDGGSPPPAVICEGQRAPAHGVFLTFSAASEYAAALDAQQHQIADLEAVVEAKPAEPIPGYVWLAACVASVVVGAFVASKVK